MWTEEQIEEAKKNDTFKVWTNGVWAELEKLENQDLFSELKDLRFITRTHGCRATYALGCRGPMCRKSERDNTRERWGKRQAAKGKKVKPVDPGPARARDEFIEKVINWHKWERTMAKSA